jgi:hypothetical protein
VRYQTLHQQSKSFVYHQRQTREKGAGRLYSSYDTSRLAPHERGGPCRDLQTSMEFSISKVSLPTHHFIQFDRYHRFRHAANSINTVNRKRRRRALHFLFTNSKFVIVFWLDRNNQSINKDLISPVK